MASLGQLQDALGHPFQNPALLIQALTHRSHGKPNNERLEFLGDSVLNFVVSTLLFAEHERMDEGALSRLRANLVKESSLAEIAVDLGLSDHLRLGEGELKSGGFRRPSILADALEAILGAIYLDGGHAAARRTIERLYRPVLSRLGQDDVGKDAKTQLQELLQGYGHPLPVYDVLTTHGAAHEQTFDVVCHVEPLDVHEQASGPSRRSAEQAAAARVLAQLRTRGSLRRKATGRRRNVASPESHSSTSHD
ncbi:ribonuclease III [Castellaniella sp.]|uniref:ribonuclease III n=1 Tax=Castellaniella sp. TaxID=1955812 RepID=UPI003560B649